MARKKSSKKYLLTINNPVEKGYTHDRLKQILDEFSLTYWCMCDEIGDEGTYHTHLFFVAKSGVMFDTVKKRIPGAHIDKSNGTNLDNYNYIRKLGKANEEKAKTNLPETFEESGNLPPDRKCASNLSDEIIEMIMNGCSDYEIISEHPSAMNRLNSINQARTVFEKEKSKKMIRKMYVCYIWGETGSGKTRFVMDKYGFENVYRVTDYDHPFDEYEGQKVIAFEEFRSSIDIVKMLNYLDIYPLQLPCRYSNKIALYDTVYITTNIPVGMQYIDAQDNEPETYNAFLRRINDFIEMKIEKEDV